jgi:hypothetical protein
VPHFFSASQIDTFLGCRRKWAWDKVARVPRPQNDSAKLGDCTHKQLETYLAGGPLDFTEYVNGINVGNVAASGVHLLPAPNAPGVQIETSFRFTSPDTGFTYVGRKDVEGDCGSVIPVVEGEPDVPPGPFVLDHKTTGNLRWAKTPDDLSWDPQAQLYARALLEERGVGAVNLVWTYYQTKGGKASKRVHLRVTSSHANRTWRAIEDVARDMASTSEGLDGGDAHAYVNTLSANPKACSAYGGCPYQHVCRLSPAERMKAIMSSGDDVIDSLRKRAEVLDGGSVAPTAPAPTPAPATVDLLSLKKPSTTPAPAPTLGINPPEATQAVTLTASDPVEAAGYAAVAAPEAAAPAAEPMPKKTRAKRAPKANTAPTPAPTCDHAAASGFTLYIDCLPVGETFDVAETYYAEAQALVRETMAAEGEEVADYRFIGFGKGPAAFALALGKALDESPCKSLVVSTSAQEARDALTVLVNRASRVIRGVR